MTTKITVSLPDDVVAHARRAVAEGRAPSVSAYVAEALSRMRRDSSADDFVAFLAEQHGEPSAEAYDWADRVLGLK